MNIRDLNPLSPSTCHTCLSTLFAAWSYVSCWWKRKGWKLILSMSHSSLDCAQMSLPPRLHPSATPSKCTALLTRWAALFWCAHLSSGTSYLSWALLFKPALSCTDATSYHLDSCVMLLLSTARRPQEVQGFLVVVDLFPVCLWERQGGWQVA